MQQNGYLCAFTGRRDSYQVPIALQEHDLLQGFLTNFYTPRFLRQFASMLPNRFAEKLDSRHGSGLKDDLVQSSIRFICRNQIRRHMNVPRYHRHMLAAQDFGREVARWAKKKRGDLLLYHSYAWETFSSSNPQQSRRVLFQYHPHLDFERAIYQQDARDFPEFAGNHPLKTEEAMDRFLLTRVRDAWKHADLIICASSFTKRSLVWAGAAPERCKVVTYGNSVKLNIKCEALSRKVFQVLFVGTGCLRKGLHHLLIAWKRMQNTPEKRLVLICRDIDPDLRRLAEQTNDVTLRDGVSASELARLYTQSHLFVLPSLVEGFAQVYLEALSYGCPVLGTPNSALPDLGTEADGVFMVKTGSPEELQNALERLRGTLLKKDSLRAAARECAVRRPWAKFRSELVSALSH